MGRTPWSERLTVEECTPLDIADLVTSGLFRYASPQTRYLSSRGFDIAITSLASAAPIREWTWNGRFHERSPAIGNKLTLSYKIGEQAAAEEVEILNGYSPLGRGKRFYFKCPGLDDPCGRRVGKLFLPPGERRFACRACHNLTYRSCKEHDKRVDALVRSPFKLEELLNSKNPRKVYPALRAALRLRTRMKI